MHSISMYKMASTPCAWCYHQWPLRCHQPPQRRHLRSKCCSLPPDLRRTNMCLRAKPSTTTTTTTTTTTATTTMRLQRSHEHCPDDCSLAPGAVLYNWEV